MQATITTLSAHNFHEVVTLVWTVVNGDGGVGYKRAEAETYVKNNSENIIVLEIADEVFGMYSFYDNPNVYTLSFFALDKRVRRKKIGYSLFLDMKNRLVGKPVIVPIYSDNDLMVKVVKKRGQFMGSFRAAGDKILDYYTISFGDKEWEK